MPSGGFRIGAGRPKGSANKKKLEGKAVKTSASAQPKPLPKKTAPNNVMADYFSMAMKECEKEVPAAMILISDKSIRKHRLSVHP